MSEKAFTMDAKKETAGEERGAQLGDPRPPLSTTQNFPFTPPARDRGHATPPENPRFDTHAHDPRVIMEAPSTSRFFERR